MEGIKEEVMVRIQQILNSSPSRFQCLPSEIRLVIYRLALQRDYVYPFQYRSMTEEEKRRYQQVEWMKENPPTVNLLQVCRLFHYEAEPMLYRDNVFVFYRLESICNFMRSRSDVQKRAWIRYIDIMALDYSHELKRPVSVLPFWPMIMSLMIDTGTENQIMEALPWDKDNQVEIAPDNVHVCLRLACRITGSGQLYLTYVGHVQQICPLLQEPFRYQCWRYNHLQAGVWHLLKSYIPSCDTLNQE